MKQVFLEIMKVLFYPLIWCHRVIMEAPLIDVDNALSGYSEWKRYSAMQDQSSRSNRR